MGNKINNNRNIGWKIESIIFLIRNEHPNWAEEVIFKKAQEIIRNLNQISSSEKRSSDKYYYNTLSFNNMEDTDFDNNRKQPDLEYLIEICDMQNEIFE